jgi:Helix-turn-helix domain
MVPPIRNDTEWMGLVTMSERDLKRMEVLSEVLVGRRTVVAAASVLGVSERQAYRLLARYQVEGGSGLAHKARGRESNHSMNQGFENMPWNWSGSATLISDQTLATEVLAEDTVSALGVRRCGGG